MEPRFVPTKEFGLERGFVTANAEVNAQPLRQKEEVSCCLLAGNLLLYRAHVSLERRLHCWNIEVHETSVTNWLPLDMAEHELE